MTYYINVAIKYSFAFLLKNPSAEFNCGRVGRFRFTKIDMAR